MLTEIPPGDVPVLIDLDTELDGSQSCVYFIQEGDDGPIKIGVSTIGSVHGRLRSVQRGNPRVLRLRRVVRGGYGLEGTLHKRYAEHRMVGEWFEPHEEVLAVATPETFELAAEVERLRSARQRLRKAS